MAMLMTHMAIAGMAKMAIMAIMVTSVKSNGNFSMAVRGGFRTHSYKENINTFKIQNWFLLSVDLQ